MKKQTLSLAIISALTLSACGGSSGSSSADSDDTAIYGPLSTGSVSEPAFAYFDLDTMTQVELTETEAETNTVWDIAFKRTGVYLNNAQATPVSAYFTGNNSDFYDESGSAVADMFTAATPETELADFTSVSIYDLPADDEEFVADVTSNIIDDWYTYNFMNHSVSANPENYFIVDSDTTFSKFSVTDLTQDGFAASDITITYANQTSVDTEFETTTTDIVVDAVTDCSSDGIFIDFDMGQVVTSADDYDLMLTCNDDNTGINFDLDIADDALALQDFDNNYDAIDPAAISYYGFQSNEYTVKAFDENPWYAYGVNGGHTMWSQYGVYLIKNEATTFKLQITSYYDTDGVSGNISFRAEALVAE